MSGFDFATAPRIVCEDAAALRLTPLLASLGVRRPLIVTDAGLVAAGLVTPVAEALAARDRARCGPVAPSTGLYLTGVVY